MSGDICVSFDLGDRRPASFALAFAITQLVEVPIYMRALRLREPSLSAPRRALIAFGASLFTHPIVWFAAPRIAILLYVYAVQHGAPMLDEIRRTLLYGALAEGFAVIVEALYLKAFRVKSPLLWSLLANGASVVVGALVMRML